MMLLLTCVWTILAIPGKHFFYQTPNGINADYFQHGWPMVAYERANGLVVNPMIAKRSDAIEVAEELIGSRQSIVTSIEGRDSLSFLDADNSGPWRVSDTAIEWSDDELDSLPYWWKKRNWNFSADVFTIHWLALATNVASFIVLIGAAFIFFQWRFRKRGVRISLKELAAVTAVIAIFCMYFTSIGIFEKNRLALEALESVKLYDHAERFDIYPETLVRISGRRWLPRASHFRSLVVDFRTTPVGDKKLLNREFKSLRYLLIAKITAIETDMGNCLGYLKRTRELTIVGPSISAKQWRLFSRLKDLKILRISSLPDGEKVFLPNQFFLTINQLGSLEELNLENCSFSSEDFGRLINNDSIKRLKLSSCDIDGTTIATVGTFSRLTYFGLNQDNVARNELEKLKRNRPRLQVNRK